MKTIRNLGLSFLILSLSVLLLTGPEGKMLPQLFAQDWQEDACRITYKVTGQWKEKFAAQIVLTNLAAPIDGWTLGWVFPGGQTITQIANGNYVQNEAVVSVVNGVWNRTLQTDQKTVIAFQAMTGSAHPTEFTLNGALCEAELHMPLHFSPDGSRSTAGSLLW